MRLGISHTLSHTSPAEWAEKTVALGLSAVVFPLDYTADDAAIDAYAQACRAHDLLIAEVGAWSNPLSPDRATREAALTKCIRQLELADHIGARCCVNIAGACGEKWDGGYAENYAPETFSRIVDSVQRIIDAAKPRRAAYSLEPMQWMLPDSPEAYLRLIEAVGRGNAFHAHLDLANMILSPQRYFLNGSFAARCFALLHGHIRSCHLKDVHLDPAFTVRLYEVPCGEGELDLANYAALAHEEDPDMPMIIEHLEGEDAYLASLAYVQDMLRQVGVPH